MDADKLREILKKEYNIDNDKELDVAIEKSIGIDIEIFTMPLSKKSEIYECRTKTQRETVM